MKTVYHNPDDAAPLYMKDWSAKVEGAVTAANQFEAKIGTDLRNEASGLFLRIDEANSSMQSHFRMAYAFYSDDPCKYDDWLAHRICELIDRENRLRNLILEIKMLERLVAARVSKPILIRAISDSLRKLSRGDMDPDMLEEFSKVKDNISTWEGIAS